ncbi:MAG: hypothetical protein IPJ65_24270 [Archangiaceae bacterium]|nr:hypothetical protein [Archangiaceae bacterium]
MKCHLTRAALLGAMALACAWACGGTPPETMLGAEICDNGKDDNGDKKTDCADPKCFSNAKCRVRLEICDNGLDDDVNGDVDCADLACQGQSCGIGCTCNGGARTESGCSDTQDNDGDNRTDCQDLDCAMVPPCGGGPGGGGGTGGGSSGTGGGTSSTGGGTSSTGGGTAGGRAGGAGTSGGSGTAGGTATAGGTGTAGGAGTNLVDGAPCTADNQCAGGKCLTEAASGYPRGLCTNADVAPCTNWPSNAGCHGGRCVNNHCYAGCTGKGLSGSDACRAGYACADVIDTTPGNNNNVCVALCSTDAECAGSNGSFGCNPWSRYCEQKDRGKTKYGGPCVNGSDCEGGACLTGSGWPGGYCAGNCRGDTFNCGPNGYCYYDYSSSGDNVGICAQSCSTLGNNCRTATGTYGPTDYRCYADGNGQQMGRFCFCIDPFQPCADDRACCSGSCGLILQGVCD